MHHHQVSNFSAQLTALISLDWPATAALIDAAQCHFEFFQDNRRRSPCCGLEALVPG
jgi:hypothetical protein